MSDRRTRCSVRRAGFTLAEVVVALALSSIVGTALCGVLIAQQRVYRNATERLMLRHAVRDAAEVLPAELRGVGMGGGLAAQLSDTAVELYTVVGSSIVCTATSMQLTLPPDTLLSGALLTSLAATPDTGDLAAVYMEPADSTRAATWERIAIADVSRRAAANGCPASTGFTTPSDASSMAYVVTFALTQAAPPKPGAPVRFLRRGRFSVYRSSDARWYLGYRRCAASGVSLCGTIQPVSGPYASARAGLRFRYRDRVGNAVLAPPWESIALVEIAVRSVGRPAGTATAGDSTAVVAALRNAVQPGSAR